MPSPALGLGPLLDTRRVILVVGCGGVGKTTTTAALGLAAARRGKRVLCLTIDPARRLSQSLGFEEMTTEARRRFPGRLLIAEDLRCSEAVVRQRVSRGLGRLRRRIGEEAA